MADKAKPVDLASFDDGIKRQDAGILVPIKGPDGKTLLGFSVRVAGPDSERWRLAQEEMLGELISGEVSDLSARDRLDRKTRFLAKVTMEFVPNVIIGGQELSYSEDNAVKLFTTYGFVREQVDNAAGNRGSFFKIPEDDSSKP